MRRHACGLQSEPDQLADEAVSNNSNRQRHGRILQRQSKSWQHACKTVLADLSQKKEASAVAWNTVQTRVTQMLACGCARTRVSRKKNKCHMVFDRVGGPVVDGFVFPPPDNPTVSKILMTSVFVHLVRKELSGNGRHVHLARVSYGLASGPKPFRLHGLAVV